MEQLLGTVPQLVGIVEKAGLLGVLIILLVVAVWEILRLRKTLTQQYALRDKYRLAFALTKKACDDNNIRVDLTLVNDLLKESGEPA